MARALCDLCGLSPERTQEGRLAPWEVAKACAYDAVIRHIAEHLEQPASELLGKRVDVFIAESLTVVGGGHPNPRSVREVVQKARHTEWYPGKPRENVGGRPKVVTEHQMVEIARVGMGLKKRKLKPSPARVRAVLPRLSLNKATGAPLSDEFIREIFRTRCYDETEDDPWQWLSCASQDYLPDSMLPLRVSCCQHILDNFSVRAWTSHVAIDPCYSLLPRLLARLEEQQVAAMGKVKWMSKNSRRAEVNLRAAATALKQAGPSVLQVHWTPVLARGRIYVHVCDPAETNPLFPKKLNDGAELAKFVTNVLPTILQKMQEEHGWSSIPRVVVHDKASYMVNAQCQQLNPVFTGALARAGMRSWLGQPGVSGHTTAWLCAKLGDVYIHETAISHIRRLLASRFVCMRIDEQFWQFKKRMGAVQDHMNSDSFAAQGGRGLPGLCQELRDRCREVIDRKGGRIPK